ncbi:MAG TPA: flagellar protein FlaG [Noviherbaspirillum sp.]|nr:flagellar protein FlaG [Noviherbaspirillum sp.]
MNNIGPVSSPTQSAATHIEQNIAAASTSAVAGATPTPVVTATAVQPPPAAPSAEQVTQALKSINKTLQGLSQGLEFTIDEDSNRTIVKIVDKDTKDVIRQIPTKEALEIAKALDQASGLLIRQKA